jgi:Putative Actinobacterial Holin-X, holin superfamily III
MPPDLRPGDPGSASTAELVQTAVSQISTLVRDELALAKTEMLSKGKQVGVGGGLVGAAGVLALYGIGLLLALVVAALALVWPLWLALLVVTVVVFAAAAVAGLVGKQKITAAAPPVPTDTVASVHDDLQAVTDAFREGRHS